MVLLSRMVFSRGPVRRGRAGKCGSRLGSSGVRGGALIARSGSPAHAPARGGRHDPVGVQGLGSCLPSRPAERPGAAGPGPTFVLPKAGDLCVKAAGASGTAPDSHLPWPRPQVTSCWFVGKLRPRTVRGTAVLCLWEAAPACCAHAGSCPSLYPHLPRASPASTWPAPVSASG